MPDVRGGRGAGAMVRFGWGIEVEGPAAGGLA